MDLFLGLELVKASHSAQLVSTCAQLGPTEAATTVDHFEASNRLPRDSQRQHLTLDCGRIPPKKPQNQHTHWPALDSIRARSSKLHKLHIQRKIMAGTDPSEENSALCSQHLHKAHKLWWVILIVSQSED